MKSKFNFGDYGWALLKLPGKVFNTRMRLAIALSVTVLSLILVAQVFELVPNSNKPRMQARKLQTETLALTGNAIYEATGNTRAFEQTLQNTLSRTEDLRSIGLRDRQGRLIVDINEHGEHWHQPDDNRSNDRFMFVPIFHGKQQVGQLEMCYEPLMSIKSWLQSDVAKLSLFMLLTCLVAFNLLLWRILKKLDPRRGAVPRQVREALGILAEGLLVIDRRGNISLANSTFGELVGQNAEKLTGKSANDFPWQVEQMPWVRSLEEQRTVKDHNVRIQDTSGVTRTFNVSASPVLAKKGHVKGAMVTFDDITILEEHRQELIKARKAADDANEAKSVFLSRMSHEIRTPMNAIIGYTDILRQGDTNENDEAKYLSTIHTSGEHLLALINDILDLSKIEAGQMTIEQRECKLVPILRQVIETLKIRAEQAGLKLQLTIEESIPETITVDETRLRQILINTVGNAIKFTKEGGVALFARMCDENKLIEFDVADTGVGIPEDALDKIFQPFSQADDSVTRKFGGTGLGLAISKQLSEALGGGIKVTSEVNMGTVFTISIDPGPLDDAHWITAQDVAREKQTSSSSAVESRRFESGHILIVDDAEANRDLAAVMLERIGLTSDKAINGQEAIDMIDENQYDVVLMDINMPVMDGLTATRKLRDAGSTIRILALTAMAIDEEKQRCIEAGCDGFLAKPIRLPALIEGLSPYLSLAEGAEATPEDRRQSEERRQSDGRRTDDNPAAMDDIEQGLAQTLADLGIEEPAEPSAPAPVSSGELVLPEVARCSMPLDSPAVREIFDSFVKRLNQRLPEFRQAWEAKNYNTLSDLGHWLAGAAGTIGLDDFVAPARELEYSEWTDPQRDEEVLEFIGELTNRIETPVST